MSIFRGSRFEGVPFTAIRTEGGIVKRFLHLRTHLKAEDVKRDFRVRTILEPTQLDNLAKEDGGKETLYWVIADVNEILFPLDVPDGTQLLIPSKVFFSGV